MGWGWGCPSPSPPPSSDAAGSRGPASLTPREAGLACLCRHPAAAQPARAPGDARGPSAGTLPWRRPATRLRGAPVPAGVACSLRGLPGHADSLRPRSTSRVSGSVRPRVDWPRVHLAIGSPAGPEPGTRGAEPSPHAGVFPGRETVNFPHTRPGAAARRGAERRRGSPAPHEARFPKTLLWGPRRPQPSPVIAPAPAPAAGSSSPRPRPRPHLIRVPGHREGPGPHLRSAAPALGGGGRR